MPLPPGFTPLPHVNRVAGGQVIPNNQIDEISTHPAARDRNPRGPDRSHVKRSTCRRAVIGAGLVP